MAVTVNYVYPVAGTTTPPTKHQLKGRSEVSFDIVFGTDADTGAVVTHNLGLVGPISTTGTDGTPRVHAIPTALGAQCPQLIVAFSSQNAITLTKASVTTTVGSTGTWRVNVIRPHTMSR